MTLTPRQRQFLKGLGHPLQPVVQVSEISSGVVREADLQLGHHELIKVRITIDDRQERRQAVDDLAAKTASEIVQAIGKTALLYRPNPERKQPIRLPGAKAAGVPLPEEEDA